MAVLQNTSTTASSHQDPAPCPVVMRSRPVLSKKAIQIMESWYHDNINHPYPNYSTIKNMAQQASLKEEQIRKWFGNKRNRCRNARPYNKKQKKLTATHIQCMLWFYNCAVIVIIKRKVLFHELLFYFAIVIWNMNVYCYFEIKIKIVHFFFFFFYCFPIAGLIVGKKTK